MGTSTFCVFPSQTTCTPPRPLPSSRSYNFRHSIRWSKFLKTVNSGLVNHLCADAFNELADCQLCGMPQQDRDFASQPSTQAHAFLDDGLVGLDLPLRLRQFQGLL